MIGRSTPLIWAILDPQRTPDHRQHHLPSQTKLEVGGATTSRVMDIDEDMVEMHDGSTDSDVERDTGYFTDSYDDLVCSLHSHVYPLNSRNLKLIDYSGMHCW